MLVERVDVKCLISIIILLCVAKIELNKKQINYIKGIKYEKLF
jgi:hypothetical protein